MSVVLHAIDIPQGPGGWYAGDEGTLCGTDGIVASGGLDCDATCGRCRALIDGVGRVGMARLCGRPSTLMASDEPKVDEGAAEARAAGMQRIRDLVDRSSFGTPEAKRLRASVTDEQARRVVARAEQLRPERDTPEPPEA